MRLTVATRQLPPGAGARGLPGHAPGRCRARTPGPRAGPAGAIGGRAGRAAAATPSTRPRRPGRPFNHRLPPTLPTPPPRPRPAIFGTRTKVRDEPAAAVEAWGIRTATIDAALSSARGTTVTQERERPACTSMPFRCRTSGRWPGSFPTGTGETVPSTVEGILYPVHPLQITAMGMLASDSLNLEDLAEACEAEQRWEFMVVLAPLRIPRATGSPFNPIAVL